MDFINLHTHKQGNCECICIQNHTLGLDKEPFTSNSYFSVGIHPGYLQNYQQQTELLYFYSKKDNNIAIGECGLDHFSSFPLELQEKVFIAHINLAEEIQKPIIIHCVRAHNDLIRIKKKTKSSVPWIIHGFNTNNTILHNCLKENIFISVGNKLLFNTHKETLKDIPLDFLFIETDEEVAPIQNTYEKVAEIKEIPLDELKERLHSNFLKVFKLP